MTANHLLFCGVSAAVALLASFPLANRASAAEKLELTVVDADTGKPIPCRMHLKTARGRTRRVRGLPFWHDHFVLPGSVTLKLPRGTYTFEIERGPEYVIMSGHFTIQRNSDDTKTVKLKRIVDMKKEGWWSGELHVHRPVKDIQQLMRAEDLHVAPVITWWNKRNYWAKRPLPGSPLVTFDKNRYYHLLAGEDERGGGALLFFNLARPLAITDAAREYPSPMKYLLEAKAKGAWVDIEKPFWWDVPVWLASGRVDSIGICNNHMQRDKVYPGEAWGKPRDKSDFTGTHGNGRWSQHIYYQMLNAGLRIPPSAGSASGVLHNPVGYNRMYVHVDGEFTYKKWWDNFRAGRVIVTNGPLLRPRVNGKLPGHVFKAPAGKELELEIRANLTTRDKIQYLEIVKNGRVAKTFALRDFVAKRGRLPKLTFKQSGWFLIRAITDVRKTFRFCSTAPYYVEIGKKPRVSKTAAKFFLDWVNERIGRLKLADAKKRQEVLKYHNEAKKFWEAKLAAASD